MVKMDPDEVMEVCSDEEEFKAGIGNGSFWSPTAEEVSELYEKITTSKFLELSWQCPGRSNPNDEASLQEVQAEPAVKEEEPETKTEFDSNFDDDDKPTLRPTLKSTPKGSAKKKTTSLAGILNNMERTRYIEELGSEGRTLLLQISKPITSTPDSISQSIDRVLGSQAALERTETQETPPPPEHKGQEDSKEEIIMETDSSCVMAPLPASTAPNTTETTTDDTCATITTAPAIPPDPSPPSGSTDKATNDIHPIITATAKTEKSESESADAVPTPLASTPDVEAPPAAETAAPSTSDPN